MRAFGRCVQNDSKHSTRSMRLECHYYRHLLLLLCSWRLGRASAFIIGGSPSPSYSSLTSLVPTKRGGIRKGGGGVLPLPLHSPRDDEITGVSVCIIARFSHRCFDHRSVILPPPLPRMLLLRDDGRVPDLSHISAAAIETTTSFPANDDDFERRKSVRRRYNLPFYSYE